jgi:hypothetical protein
MMIVGRKMDGKWNEFQFYPIGEGWYGGILYMYHNGRSLFVVSNLDVGSFMTTPDGVRVVEYGQFMDFMDDMHRQAMEYSQDPLEVPLNHVSFIASNGHVDRSQASEAAALWKQFGYTDGAGPIQILCGVCHKPLDDCYDSDCPWGIAREPDKCDVCGGMVELGSCTCDVSTSKGDDMKYLDLLRKMPPLVAILAWDCLLDEVSKQTIELARNASDEEYEQYDIVRMLAAGNSMYPEELARHGRVMLERDSEKVATP